MNTPCSTRLVSTAAEYAAIAQHWKAQKVALVPTMGALHEGHAALIRKARELADVVVVSIFVNPLQFGPQEDLSRYPRQLEKDMALCDSLGVDVVFHPSVEVLYPNGMDNLTRVIPPSQLTDGLCGAFRPGHFTGVATVVLKLFNLLRPELAVFGEKDAQQLAVIRQMVADLHVPVEIVPCPTVRDVDGLALSSRNAYLQSAEEKRAALLLIRILREVREAALQVSEPLPARETLDSVSQRVIADFRQQEGAAVRFEVQYLEAVDAQTFAPATVLKPGVKLLMAAYVNQVRLIDNLDI
ncbi:MAG TPA: pantoate--beta-alanine ligase [Oculatellaceae cyanobacterium]